MSKIIEGLNKEQKAAVLHTKGPLAIIAGAGSGKTKTLIAKLAYLINEIGIPPSKILAVTFTNKAANEMKTRVVELIGSKAQNIQISTYHSLGAKILRQEISIFGYPKDFNILDDLDQKQILAPIYKKYKVAPRTLSYKEMIAYISKNKILKNNADQLIKESKNDTELIKNKIYKDYVAKVIKIKSLDFDDLLLFVQKLFLKCKDTCKKWSKKFEYILVDEFQDTSFIQYEIIKILASHSNITIVGDPDQTIYTWRLADVNLINNFKKYFSNAAIIKLEQNYRSTQTILNAANKLIFNNKKRLPKKLFSHKDKGDILDFYHGFSDDAEARWVIQKIQELKRNKNQLKDIAILYRANYLSQPIEKALINTGINYVIFGGIKFYQRQEIKDVVAFLKIINCGDEVSLIRMINVPSRKIGATAINKLMKFSEELNLSLFEAITKNFKEIPLTTNQKSDLAIFVNIIRKHKKALDTNSISLVLESFIAETNYMSIWKTTDDQSRFENVRQFIESIRNWENDNQNGTLFDYLSEISLYVDRETSKNRDYISLMTVHSSKGLEFKNVFIVGFSEGVFPSIRAIEESGNDGLEEERRLAYVAVTRAKDKIFISNSRGYAIDHKTQKKPSRFIKELGINIRDFTSEFIAPKNYNENYKANNNFIIGDKISHVIFGEGVILNVIGDLIKIIFKAPYGEKTLMKNHKSIERAGR